MNVPKQAWHKSHKRIYVILGILPTMNKIQLRGFEHIIPLNCVDLIWSTGKKDRNGEEILLGHKLVSQFDDSVVEVKYGEHAAYCGHDNTWMTNCGFYVESTDGEQMPLGPTEYWATIKGDIYETV